MNPTATDYANRKAVTDALLAAVPNRMTQMRTPSLKQHTYSATTALSLAQAFTSTNVARIGHHNDCFLASSSDYGTYTNVSTEYPYLEQETKYVPMGGETCALNAPRSECASAITEMARFHWSFMNVDYNEQVIAGFQNNNCFTEMQNRLGYRFELVSGTYPTTAIKGTAMPVTIKIKNSGFATPFNARTVYLIFRNTATNIDYRVPMATNPRFWNAATTTTVTETVTVPSTLGAGTYKLYLDIPDSDAALSLRPEYSIRLANNNTWDSGKGYNNLLHTMTITSPLARIGDDATTMKDAAVYPVPSSNALVIEMDQIEKYTVGLSNSLGQKMVVDANIDSENKMTINTENLKDGVYLVSFTLDGKTETKRIIVAH